MKKFYFKQLLIAFIAFLCCAMVNAHDFVVNDIYYNITSPNETVLTVDVTFEGSSYSSSKKTYADSVVVPETVTYKNKKYSVTGVANRAFYNCVNLTGVSLPNSVKKIGTYAFYGCTNLTGAVLPDSVKEIGTYTFYNCGKLGKTGNDYGKSYACKYPRKDRYCLFFSVLLFCRGKQQTDDRAV